jgi:preprotein translocase subunit SecF
MRIFENTHFEFIDKRKMGYIISSVLLVLSIASITFKGLELGIDFKGGMEFVLETDRALEPTEVRSALGQVLSTEPEVKTFDQTGLLVRTLNEGDISEVVARVKGTIESAFPGVTVSVEKTDIVGPRFAEDLKRGAIYSIIGALLVIFVYILIRFEWTFAVGAVAALFHDVILTLGLFSLLAGVLPFSLQIDQSIIAAFLTIVGYSLNDTVVVFDRIREYSGIFKSEKIEAVVNKSINSTLSRTVITSSTTLLVVLVLFIFGGEVLRGFAFALVIGVLVGTYSSIFVASPVVVELKLRNAGGRK